MLTDSVYIASDYQKLQAFKMMSQFQLGIAVSLAMALMTVQFLASRPKSEKPDQPIEMGVVKWNLDFESASSISAKSGKPLFVLFQEIPG